MLLEQVKSLNLRLSQSFSLLVAMVLQATSAMCGKPPATARSLSLSEFLSHSPSPLLLRKCVMISFQ